MAEGHDHQTYQRAAQAALLGLITQLAIAIGMALLGLYAEVSAMYAATWHLFAGAAIWLILWLTYKQHQLERLEALEAEQLAQSDEEAARLFDEAGQQLALARKRLENFYKYGLTVISVIVAAYLLAVGGGLAWSNYEAAPLADDAPVLAEGADALIVALLSALIAFVAFIVGRYVSGMTREPAWRLLRGGAGFMMGSALIGVLITAAAVGAFFDQPVGFTLLAVVIPAFMAVLGLEMVLALLLSVYRPRKTGEPVRPAFDSRILGWLSSPESIGRIISETLNYQFGFEISRSWFYRLLARAITPLMLIAALVLILLSSIVIVAPQQQAVITRFGAVVGEPVGPGLHLKLPWPVGGAEKYDTQRVRTIAVGSTDHVAEEQVVEQRGHDHGHEHNQTGERGLPDHLLWSDEDGHQGGDFLLTAPPRLDVAGEVPAGFGELVGARMRVQYRIADVKQYATSVTSPQTLLADLADREMNAYFATRSIETVLSGGRLEASDEIQQRLQAAVDRSGLGFRIMGVALVHVHPPQGRNVVSAFHAKVAASEDRQRLIAEARQEAVRRLASVAGSREQAMAIAEAKTTLDQLQTRARTLERQLDAQTDGGAAVGPDAPTAATQPAEELASLRDEIEAQRRRIESLIQDAGGEAASILAEAGADRWSQPLEAQGKAERFSAQLKAFHEAPRYYRTRQYLDVLSSTLKAPRKYIMTAETKGTPTIRLNLESAGSAIEQLMGETNQ